MTLDSDDFDFWADWEARMRVREQAWWEFPDLDVLRRAVAGCETRHLVALWGKPIVNATPTL